MVPKVEGIIARRILLNFRADIDMVQALLPRPFVVDTHQGAAIVGICLIRLEKLRPKGFPSQIGITSENAAHRVAVRYPQNREMKPGVFIWRRETDQKLVQMFGGKLFPGIHDAARFEVEEDDQGIHMEMHSSDGRTDVNFAASLTTDWRPTTAFDTLQEASAFFEQGSCGFSCSLRPDRVEGMKLRTFEWSMRPLNVELRKTAFYEDTKLFPKGSIEFDCGLIMQQVPHEWHEIKETPTVENVSGFQLDHRIYI
jgi:hypothetical protein